MPQVALSTKIDIAIWQLLEDACKSTGKSKREIIEAALKKYLTK